MRGTLVLLAFALLVATAAAETELRAIAWTESATLPEGSSVESDGTLTLTSEPGGATRRLVVIDAPGIQKDLYVVRGRVRYEAVEGEGYLEMWNDFPEGSSFTRTLADEGPLQKIAGSSDWRAFALYFDASSTSAPTSRLTINLVLPGEGEVSLSAMTLAELESDEWPSMGSRATGTASGWWGGLAGAALGICGGVLSWLGSRGRAKTLVLAGLKTMVALGVVALALGFLSLGRGLPYETYYPLLLIGAIAVIAPASALPSLRRRYEELELRRMQALDVSG